jgi:hypothetical protein
MKERGPVEDFDDFVERDAIPIVMTDASGDCEVGVFPVDLVFLPLRFLKGNVDGGGAFAGMKIAVTLLLILVLREKVLTQIFGKETVADSHNERGIPDMHNWLAVVVADLNRSVGSRSGGSSNQDRK